MSRSHGSFFGGLVVLAGLAGPPGATDAREAIEPPQIVSENLPDDEGLMRASQPAAVSKVLQDTVWIADWSFDAANGACTDAGWVKWDNRILNRHVDSDYWRVDSGFSGTGNAAVLSPPSACAEVYGEDELDFSVVLKYSGVATLEFDAVVHGLFWNGFATVEADSAGASESRADPSVNPSAGPATFRTVLVSELFEGSAHVGPLSLPNYGPGVHEVYIRFVTYGGLLDIGIPGPMLVVDNVVVTGGTPYTENFEGALNPNVSLVETSNALPFRQAPWWRLQRHLTDNDKCTENLSCAWLDTDPTLLGAPGLQWGPGGAVVRNWLDDILASPWVSLASTPVASGTVLSYRIFPGNNFVNSAIVSGWRVRAKVRIDNTDSPAPGDSIDCITPWGHASSISSLSTFQWVTSIHNMTSYLPPTASEIQVSFRVSDYQYLAGGGSPATFNPGPGPYIDRVRIGRRVLNGPEITEHSDSRSLAQDAFPTVVDPSITPGEHHVPDGVNRFGTCAFSAGRELGFNGNSTRHITGDSIWLEKVSDTRGAGGIASVRFYGAIVSGPHVGKVPGPYTTAGGFFQVNAENSRTPGGQIIVDRWFVDLDDTYFRGGDVMKYFLAAVDNGGGFTSTPIGLTSLPSSVAQAEAATGGLHEVGYLPTINWDSAYLAAVAAHATGDVDPTQAQIDNSTQANCILYNQMQNSRRRSGPLNRTSFMYTLDELGYRGDYDVFDVQGYGNTNNQLGSRANVAQCSGYALVIQDDGRSNFGLTIPAGENSDFAKIDQAGWYRAYLAQGASGLAGTATLWLIGENTAFNHRSLALIGTDFGLTNIADNQGLIVNPNVRGVASNTWANGNVTTFAGDEFSLQGGCPAIRAYDMASSASGSTITHRYAAGMTTSTGGSIVMNRNASLEWNTVWQGFAWHDIRFASAPTNPTPQDILVGKVLAQTVPIGCLSVDPTTDPGEEPVVDAPAVTALHPNVPNPFNPATRIAFDLATAGRVRLHIYDVAGKLVRTLVDEDRAAGRYVETWTGLDTSGGRVASGVYFYRLDAASFSSTRKMVLLQ